MGRGPGHPLGSQGRPSGRQRSADPSNFLERQEAGWRKGLWGAAPGSLTRKGSHRERERDLVNLPLFPPLAADPRAAPSRLEPCPGWGGRGCPLLAAAGTIGQTLQKACLGCIAGLPSGGLDLGRGSPSPLDPLGSPPGAPGPLKSQLQSIPHLDSTMTKSRQGDRVGWGPPEF